MSEHGDLRVVDDPARGRFELRDGDTVVGFAEYRNEPGAVVIDYVEVDPALQGRRLGSRLVEHAVGEIRARGLSVVPACPFAAWYLRQHPEHADREP